MAPTHVFLFTLWIAIALVAASNSTPMASNATATRIADRSKSSTTTRPVNATKKPFIPKSKPSNLTITKQSANQCATETATEYYGKSFRKLTVEDQGKCCAACQQDKQCNVWTYVLKSAKKKAGTCWLMADSSKVDTVRENKNMVSGIRGKKPTKDKLNFEDGGDYKEKNLYKVSMKTAAECGDYCTKKLLCKAAVFDKKKKKCFGKRSTWGKRTHKDCVAAVV